MLWNRGERPGDIAAQYRRVHELWLERALRTGRPDFRIPAKAVSRGGFDGLMSRETGRQWAQAWWSAALRRVDRD